jgi:hypothetical protein
VTRRFLPILFTVAAATLAAGCTTFSDNNAAARVGDDELTDEMLEELVGMIPDPQTGGPGDPTSGGSVRNALTFWIRAQVLEQLVSDADLEIDTTLRDQAAQQASQLTGYEQLSGDSQDFVVDWYTSTAAFDTVAAPDDAAKVAFYEQGMETTGIACVSHILVETEAEADEILAELAEGADFPTLAQERSIDPGSGAPPVDVRESVRPALRPSVTRRRDRCPDRSGREPVRIPRHPGPHVRRSERRARAVLRLTRLRDRPRDHRHRRVRRSPVRRAQRGRRRRAARLTVSR